MVKFLFTIFFQQNECERHVLNSAKVSHNGAGSEDKGNKHSPINPFHLILSRSMTRRLWRSGES